MQRPWSAEHEVSIDRACELIESQFPELAPAALEPFGVGFDNIAFLVNGTFVFRFPRRQLGADCMAAELAVLPHLAGKLPLPIPSPAYIGTPEDDYPWSFAGYQLLMGQTACVANLKDDEREQLAKPLAQFLARLHRFPVRQAKRWGADHDTLGRLDLKKRIPMARDYLDRLQQMHLLADMASLSALIDEIEVRDPSYGGGLAKGMTFALVHGDLYARHLLVDESKRLCGIIDWGDVHVGCLSIDLSIAHSFLPPTAHATFRASYGPISERDWLLARFRALYHSALIALYGADIGDEDLQREGLTSLRYLSSA